jgi:hypothetical protein
MGNLKMLPFLKHDKEVSVSVPTGKIERKSDDNKDQDFDEFHQVAEELINAIHSKDVKTTAEVLKAAFDLADSMPHFEGPHLEED